MQQFGGRPAVHRQFQVLGAAEEGAGLTDGRFDRPMTPIDESYAQTLRLWDERFVANAGAVGRLGFDAIFRRMWHFYLEYSRAGFASGYLDVQQLTLAREA